MDKIREEFEKWGMNNIPDENEWETYQKAYFAGNKIDLLPTERVCPGCGGSGEMPNDHIPEIKCSTCNGSGTIQLYYTLEQYEKITGKPYPDDALIWCFTPVYIDPEDEENEPYETVSYYYWKPVLRKDGTFKNDGVIVQTAQPAPLADYRPEK